MTKSYLKRSSAEWAAVLGVGCIIASMNTVADPNAVFTLPSGARVEIVEANFEKSLFTVSGCGGSGDACLINGHIPFGSDSRLPKTYLKSITVTCQGESYSLDVSNMYDAWGTRPLEYKGTIRYFGGKCFNAKNGQFRGLFSDAGGSYVAEWIIVNGVPIRTVLTGSNDIKRLFMKNIDPPTFD
jgi:hypothetical protein